MFEKRIRPLLQIAFMPLAGILSEFRAITPFVMNIAVLAVGGLILPLMLLKLKSWAVVVLWMTYFLDILNQSLAKSGVAQEKNFFYANLSRAIIDFVVVFSLYLLSPGIIAWISILLLATNMLSSISYVSLALLMPKTEKGLFYHSYGLCDRVSIMLLFSIMLAFPITYGILGVTLAVLLLCTTIFRVLEFQ